MNRIDLTDDQLTALLNYLGGQQGELSGALEEARSTIFKVAALRAFDGVGLADSTRQPSPEPNAHPAIWDLVIADMQERDRRGTAKYGVRLQPHNGRKSLIDAYQEVLDLAAYLRQEIYEREGK